MRSGILKNPLQVVSWALYDFANTIFSMNIVSLYFALWLTKEHGGKDIHYGIVYSASMAAVIIFAPLLGRLADLRSWRRLFLILSTLACVITTAMIGVLDRLDWGLILFFFANAGYQLALVFYDSLLPSIATPPEYGKVSGFGVALGYAGSIAGIAMVSPFVHAGGQVLRHHAFVPTAVLFLLFSLPCFLWVREKKTASPEWKGSLWRQSLKAVRKNPGVFPYLVTMFLVQNAVNTVILFMGVYSAEVGGFTQAKLNIFFIVATTVALITAYLQGRFVDRWGPRIVFRWVLWIWLIALLLAAMSPGQMGLWLAGCLIGAGLGGLWTSSRPLLLTLIPNEEPATFFGFNVLTGRFAALAGPLVWGLIVWFLEPAGVLRYRIAVSVLAVFILAGLFSMRGIPERHRYPPSAP
ncbi:MAG: MFS transporter [Candidatus Omnitrophota bacterium]